MRGQDAAASLGGPGQGGATNMSPGGGFQQTEEQ